LQQDQKLLIFVLRNFSMNEKDIQNLIELAESKIREGVSKEEALDSLVGAGILDIEGNFTSNYESLDTAD